MRKEIVIINDVMNGNSAKLQIGEKTRPTIRQRMFAVYRGISNSTYGPTHAHKNSMTIIKEDLPTLELSISAAESNLNKLVNDIQKAGNSRIEEYH